MSMCDKCLHREVCGEENMGEEAMIFCANLLEERPKSKWISHYDYCSKHGVLPSSLIAFWWCEQCEQAVEQPTNFCPNCGADMRGEQS